MRSIVSGSAVTVVTDGVSLEQIREPFQYSDNGEEETITHFTHGVRREMLTVLTPSIACEIIVWITFNIGATQKNFWQLVGVKLALKKP